MTGRMNREGIIVRQGDSFDILLHFRHKDGTDFDITGSSLKMTVKSSNGILEIFSVEGEILDASAGKAIIKLTPQETEIDEGNYITDIEFRLPNGDVHTVFPENITTTGIFKITKDVTGN